MKNGRGTRKKPATGSGLLLQMSVLGLGRVNRNDHARRPQHAVEQAVSLLGSAKTVPSGWSRETCCAMASCWFGSKGWPSAWMVSMPCLASAELSCFSTMSSPSTMLVTPALRAASTAQLKVIEHGDQVHASGTMDRCGRPRPASGSFLVVDELGTGALKLLEVIVAQTFGFASASRRAPAGAAPFGAAGSGWALGSWSSARGAGLSLMVFRASWSFRSERPGGLAPAARLARCA